MGKTGSVNWMQVKGVKGQIRLVPQKDAEVKKPGPNQRFKPNAGTRFARIGRGRGPEPAGEPEGRTGSGWTGEGPEAPQAYPAQQVVGHGRQGQGKEVIPRHLHQDQTLF